MFNIRHKCFLREHNPRTRHPENLVLCFRLDDASRTVLVRDLDKLEDPGVADAELGVGVASRDALGMRLAGLVEQAVLDRPRLRSCQKRGRKRLKIKTHPVASEAERQLRLLALVDGDLAFPVLAVESDSRLDALDLDRRALIRQRPLAAMDIFDRHYYRLNQLAESSTTNGSTKRTQVDLECPAIDIDVIRNRNTELGPGVLEAGEGNGLGAFWTSDLHLELPWRGTLNKRISSSPGSVHAPFTLSSTSMSTSPPVQLYTSLLLPLSSFAPATGCTLSSTLGPGSLMSS